MRLPAAYRFEEKEVFIHGDEKTGDVILSRKPVNWDDFFSVSKAAKVPNDFLDTTERSQLLKERDPFKGWKE